MTSAKLATGFVSIAIALMVPGWSRAQTCTSDADCGKGLRCVADPMATSPVVVCRDSDAGGACTPADQPPATPTMSCQAASCATDADCGTDMVCNQRASTTCTGTTPVAVKCDPTTGCDPTLALPPEPLTCTDNAACAYKWDMPCNADADCGSNFTCQPTQWTMCSGSSGTANVGGSSTSAGAGGGAGTSAPVPPTPVDAGTTVSCTSGSSYPGNCRAKVIACAVVADCPAGWSCTATSTGTAVGGAPTSGSGSASDLPMPVDAGVVVPPPVTTTVRNCQPPSTHATYPTRGGTDTSQGGNGTVSLVADAGAKGSSTPPTPTVPETQNGPTTQGPKPAVTQGSGGCSLAGSDGGALWLLGLLGLLIALRRR